MVIRLHSTSHLHIITLLFYNIRILEKSIYITWYLEKKCPKKRKKVGSEKRVPKKAASWEAKSVPKKGACPEKGCPEKGVTGVYQ